MIQPVGAFDDPAAGLDLEPDATDKPDAPLRAALVGSQIAGIAMLRFMIGIDALTQADDDTIIKAVGPTLQRYLTGDLSRASND